MKKWIRFLRNTKTLLMEILALFDTYAVVFSLYTSIENQNFMNRPNKLDLQNISYSIKVDKGQGKGEVCVAKSV